MQSRFVAIKGHHYGCATIHLINMFRNFVIAGGLGADPAKLSMAIEPIKLEEKMGIAVKSIAYGELHNINSSNNTIPMKFDTAAMLRDKALGQYSGSVFGGEHTTTIVSKHYNTYEDVADAILKSMNSYLVKRGFEGEEVTIEKSDTNSTIKLSKYITISPCSLFDVIQAESIEPNHWRVSNGKIDNPQMMGCFYLNIVENSFINGRKSRILCICPLQFRSGYSFYEFQNPTYVPIEVREFSDISLSIRDFNGKLISFSNKFDTVVTLEMRPMHYK